MAAAMAKYLVILYFSLVFLAITTLHEANAAIDPLTQETINWANQFGPYIGVVIPNLFEMNLLLQHPSFIPSALVIDHAGRRFRFGSIEGKPVILVMTGLAMLNAGVTTELLLSLFRVEGVVHYGLAGNANPSLNIGDVVIPKYWSHVGLWSWQRFGNGPNDSLPLEDNGDYTREIGYIRIANYTSNATNCSTTPDNLLSNVWYQPEEIFPVGGIPEHREQAFWVPVDAYYFDVSQILEGLKLAACLNATTCLDPIPEVKRVERGSSASIYLDNAAYRRFLHDKFNISPIEMESAAVALTCRQQRVPFIVIRALSNLAGGGTAHSNEADSFAPLAATNSVLVVVEFIKILGWPPLHKVAK